jgi:hypothetical protein
MATGYIIGNFKSKNVKVWRSFWRRVDHGERYYDFDIIIFRLRVTIHWTGKPK